MSLKPFVVIVATLPSEGLILQETEGTSSRTAIVFGTEYSHLHCIASGPRFGRVGDTGPTDSEEIVGFTKKARAAYGWLRPNIASAMRTPARRRLWFADGIVVVTLLRRALLENCSRIRIQTETR